MVPYLIQTYCVITKGVIHIGYLDIQFKMSSDVKCTVITTDLTAVLVGQTVSGGSEAILGQTESIMCIIFHIRSESIAQNVYATLQEISFDHVIPLLRMMCEQID